MAAAKSRGRSEGSLARSCIAKSRTSDLSLWPRVGPRFSGNSPKSPSGHGVLRVWLPFCGAGSFETYGGGILVVVEGDGSIPGVSRPQRRVLPGWLPMLLLAEAGRR